MSERWDRHFLGLALAHARMSKDPSTQVGAVIIGTGRAILSAGFNGLPRGVKDTDARLCNRDVKLKLIVHAEMNAVLAAARLGVRIDGTTLYLAATDDTGMVWGGPPCTRCTVELIQAGITEMVSYPVKTVPSRWQADLAVSRDLLAEVGLLYREVAPVAALRQIVNNPANADLIAPGSDCIEGFNCQRQPKQ